MILVHSGQLVVRFFVGAFHKNSVFNSQFSMNISKQCHFLCCSFILCLRGFLLKFALSHCLTPYQLYYNLMWNPLHANYVIINCRILFCLQAKSPVKTLDELNVSEVAPTPYFPSIMERNQNGSTHEDTRCFNSESNLGFNSESNLGFGMRRKHRCLVVTARAQSFLYHQVGFLLVQPSLVVKYYYQGTILQIHILILLLDTCAYSL